MKWIRLVDSQDLIYTDVYSITNLNDALIHDNDINKNLQNNRYNVMLFAWTHNGHLATYNPAHTNIHYSQHQTTSHIKYIHSATRSNINPFSLLKSKCPHTSLFTHIFTTVTPPFLWFKQLAEKTSFNSVYIDRWPLVSHFVFIQQHVGDPVINGEFPAWLGTHQLSLNHLYLQTKIKVLRVNMVSKLQPDT